ncbi:hypothetical protein ACFWPQ_19890 [Streptomyces sp. NPDC058464]|uniref:hypothetical protein n=1 Tax=Streptomyces sp. NPDC058464 TaxID=3346511 RepID=UPI0036603F0E
MTGTGGPQFFGPVSGSQFAIGNRDVVQHQYVGGGDPVPQLVTTMRALLTGLETLGLSPEGEATVRQDARAVLDEVANEQPDEGRLRLLVSRIRTALSAIAAGAVTGAATGAAELVQRTLTDLHRALL